MPHIQQKIIIIGATSGIGRHLAQLYAQKGWLVGATGRRAELLQSLQAAYPGNIVTQEMDVTAEEALPRLQQLIERMQGMDLLLYNSGYGEAGPMLSWETDRQTTQTNVAGFVWLANYAFNFFIANRQPGHIAATSSIAAIRGNGYAPAYSASKAYMSTYLEGLYIRAKKQRLPISITDIQPGFVDTKMAKGHKRFWVAPPEKAARQIYRALERKQFRVYITRRWWLIAKLLKWAPDWLYHRL
jgi:short-subunit dehydrogenase